MHRRIAVMSRVLVTMALASATLAVAAASAPSALAAGTTLFDQPFHDNTVDGPAGTVSVPSGTNAACLTASGNSTANPLASCPSPNDAQGSGKLRLTPDSTNKVGSIFATTSVPTSQGLDAKFNTYQYGTGTPSGADGLGFVLAAVNPASPATPTASGPTGGSLGYSALKSGTAGLPNGYLGVGLDAFGNFSNGSSGFEGTGCTDPSNITSRMPGQVVIRGPGNGTAGYCALQSSAATANSASLTLRANTRAASLIPVEVVINPTSSSLTTASGLVVPAGDYEVAFTPIGGSQRTMIGALPVVPSGLYPSSWVSSSGIPKQLAFGWVGSTGSVIDFHEIDNVLVTSLNPVPKLAVSQTSFAASVSQGSPVTYAVSASSSGAAETFPVTVTETLPAGVVPVSATGTGWACAAPVGQQISCTNSTSPFTSGTLTINAIVTGTSVTQAAIQNSITVVASSSDAAPASSSSAPAGTVPSAPVVSSLSPNNGPAGGNNAVTITGSNLSGATVIEIGTSNEFKAGTVATLALCSAPAIGCFTITNSTTIAISSMPAHAAGAVTVSVVSRGIAGSASYTYNPGPALLFPAPPGGEVGVAYSNQLTVTGGTSPFTWSVPSGSLPPGITLGASTGLLSGTPTTGGTFSFTVKVTDNAGLSDSAPVSITIVPAPTMTFSTPPNGFTSTIYSNTLTVSGGTSPYTWSLASGSLPPGVSLNASGVLTGTPTATGTFSFTARVTDANGQVATKATTLTINAGVSTNFPAPPGAVVSVPYSVTLTATGGTAPYRWSLNSGTLPAGLTLSPAGVLSGTPTTAGSSTFVVAVTDANNGVATVTITLVVTTAGLTIALSSDTGSTTPGSVVHYTVVVTNSGQSAFTGATFTDSLAGVIDDATYNSDAVATAGSASFSSPNLTWTGNLAVGATATITYSVTVKNPDTGDKMLSSKVTSTTTGNNCPSGSTDSRCSNSVSVLVPGLTIVASAASATTAPGATVRYTITVTNSGQTVHTGATFTDPLSGVLDDATFNADASATAGSVSFTSPSLTWTGNLAVGASATITFSVTVKDPDPGNDILTSTVTSATMGSNCAAGSGDANCTVTVKVAVLTIASSSNVASTTPGGVVRLTGTFTNAGQVPYTDITIATSAAGIFDDAAPNGDETATTGTLTVTPSGVSWTGDIPVGGSVTITGTVTVKDPDTGDKVLESALSTTAAGSNCPAESTDPRCAVNVPVLVPGLSISQAANAAFAIPGQTVTFTVTIANTGQTPYSGAVVTTSIADMGEDTSYDNDAAATTGALTFSNSILTWTGNLAPGNSAVITYSVTVDNPDDGDKLLISIASSTETGSNCPPGSSNAGCRITIPVLTPGLTFTQSADAETPLPGQVVGYTMTIENTGQIPYTGATLTVGLAGVLDDAAYNGDGSATAGSVSFASPSLTWTGNLAPNATATITFSVTVNNPDTGDKSLVTTLVSNDAGSECETGSTDVTCTDTVPVVNATTLTFTLDSDVQSVTAGGVVHYTITVANSGLSALTGVAFTESLGEVLDDASFGNNARATAGTVSFSSPNLTWTGTVPASGTVTITYSATVDDPDTGNKILAGTLSSPSAGSNCAGGSTDPRCTSTVTVSGLEIVNSSDVSTTTPGGVVRFTATFTNTGQTFYDGITVATNASDVFDDASPNGDETVSSGTLETVGGGLTWDGDIAPGETITITGTVSVKNPDPGNKLLAATITTDAPGSDCPDGTTDPDCSVSVAVQVPGLTITKTAAVSTTTPGAVVGYTITIADTGDTSYTGATVTDSLAGTQDDSVYDNDGAATIGAVSAAGNVLTWTGGLSPGQSAVVSYTVTIKNPDPGGKFLANTATSTAVGSNCEPDSPAPECTAGVVVLIPELTIAKTADHATATPGTTVGYTITVANTGQTPYTGATVTDSLAGVLADAAFNNDANATSGSINYAAPALTWTGDLDVGASVTITYSVTVTNPDTGGRVLTNTATSSAAGSTCPPGSPAPACTATISVVAGTLSITVPVAANIGEAAPGDSLSASLGNVQVTDNRGFGAGWTATVSSSTFTTAGGTSAETIPLSDVSYAIAALIQQTGNAAFSFVPSLTLSTAAQAVVSATNVGGNTTAIWNPLITVRIPAGAVAGTYTATITHSVS